MCRLPDRFWLPYFCGGDDLILISEKQDHPGGSNEFLKLANLRPQGSLDWGSRAIADAVGFIDDQAIDGILIKFPEVVRESHQTF
jgi:hypothetical protein